VTSTFSEGRLPFLSRDIFRHEFQHNSGATLKRASEVENLITTVATNEGIEVRNESETKLFGSGEV
jgi:predicted secreted Zn-dependent protease